MRKTIASVGYLNAWPLTSKIDRSEFRLIADHSSAVARMLEDGVVDLALVPVASVLGGKDLRVLPGYAIGADGPAHMVHSSVRVGSRSDLRRWGTRSQPR